MSETNWDEMIDDVEYYHCEAVNVRTRNMDKAANSARAALRSAISAVEQERDNYRTIAHGLQDADIIKQAEIERIKSQLAEAEADAERLATKFRLIDHFQPSEYSCRYCGGEWGLEGEYFENHSNDCPITLHRARLARKGSA